MIKSTKDFKELTGNRLNNLSQLQKFEIWIDENYNYFYNIFQSFDIKDEIKNDDTYIIYYDVEESDFLEDIAYKFYEYKRLWWIIALMNDIYNPYEELVQGTRIKILESKYLYNIIKDIRRIKK